MFSLYEKEKFNLVPSILIASTVQSRHVSTHYKLPELNQYIINTDLPSINQSVLLNKIFH